MRRAGLPRTLLSSPACCVGAEHGQTQIQIQKRQARYTWRPVVELHWVVVRLNEDGSESFYSRYETEEDAKKTAAVMDKAAQEGRE